VVEVEEAMIPAARLFEEHNNYVLDDERVTLSINDARNELEFSSQAYDVIISEPSNPWMTVASNLFTADFFRMARQRVRPGGIFCQWIQNYYLPAEDMRSVVAAFRESFPYVLLFETFDGIDQLLLGSQEPLEFDMEKLQVRMEKALAEKDKLEAKVENSQSELGKCKAELEKVHGDSSYRSSDYNDWRQKFSRVSYSWARSKNARRVLAYGAEAAARCTVTDWWQIAAAYTLFNLESDSYAGTSAAERGEDILAELGDPEHQFNIRSSMDLPYALSLDAALYYVSALAFAGHDGLPTIPDYTRVDVRIAWRAAENIEISLTGQNLQNPDHQETSDNGTMEAGKIQRSVYGKVVWEF